MKLSKAVAPAVSVGSFVAIVAIGGVLLIQNATRPTSTPIMDQHVAVVSSLAHSSSAVVAKPLAVVPRSSVVVKKPAVQEATVTDPSTDVATETTVATVATPESTPATRDPNVGPPVRTGAPAGPTCVNGITGEPC